MKRSRIATTTNLLLFAMLCVGSLAATQPAVGEPGPLVVVGGGGPPDDVLAPAIELAGGPGAHIVVLPQASATERAGESSVRMFEAAGAQDVHNWRFEGSPGTEGTNGPWPSIEETVEAIEAADLIWFPGGGQGRLFRTLAEAGLADLIRQRHRDGTVVGGSSAGAAVMAAVMINGDDYDLEAVTAGSTTVADGLGLWPDVLIDQHFLKRQRNNRLLAAVLDHPELVGIGIDERTAVIVLGNRFEVMGESSVIVFDARDAEVSAEAAASPAAATGMRLHVLTAGMSLDLAR